MQNFQLFSPLPLPSLRKAFCSVRIDVIAPTSSMSSHTRCLWYPIMTAKNEVYTHKKQPNKKLANKIKHLRLKMSEVIFSTQLNEICLKDSSLENFFSQVTFVLFSVDSYLTVIRGHGSWITLIRSLTRRNSHSYFAMNWYDVFKQF